MEAKAAASASDAPAARRAPGAGEGVAGAGGVHRVDLDRCDLDKLLPGVGEGIEHPEPLAPSVRDLLEPPLSEAQPTASQSPASPSLPGISAEPRNCAASWAMTSRTSVRSANCCGISA